MTSDSSTVQIVKSIPADETAPNGWIGRDIQNTSPEEEDTATMGAAFAFDSNCKRSRSKGQETLTSNETQIGAA